MGYGDCIRIERDRDGFSVTVNDPEIEAANNKRNSKDDGPYTPWQDPSQEYNFETKEQVLAFIEKAMDIALPTDTYSSAFDKLAKQAKEVDDG